MSADYKISIPHFYQLEYRECGRVMLLEIDFRDEVIYLDAGLVQAWEPPHAGLSIDPAEKRVILDRVYHYLVNERGFQNVAYSRCEGCGGCCAKDQNDQ